MRTPSHRLLLMLTVLAALALPAAAAARTHTIETIFHPFKADGTPTIHVRSRSGYCYTGSLAIARSDAWRCFVGNDICDPCFSSALSQGEVVCPDVNLTSGIEIKLTRGLPRRSADSGKPSLRNQPWDIELTDGRHFGFASGASNIIDGKRLNYFCARAAGSACGAFPAVARSRGRS